MDSGRHGGISFNGQSDCHTVAIGIGGDGQVDGSVLSSYISFGSLVEMLRVSNGASVWRVVSSSRASRLN